MIAVARTHGLGVFSNLVISRITAVQPLHGLCLTYSNSNSACTSQPERRSCRASQENGASSRAQKWPVRYGFVCRLQASHAQCKGCLITAGLASLGSFKSKPAEAGTAPAEAETQQHGQCPSMSDLQADQVHCIGCLCNTRTASCVAS